MLVINDVVNVMAAYQPVCKRAVHSRGRNCIKHEDNIEYVSMETKQWFLCIVALRMLLPTVWNTLRSSCKVLDIVVEILKKFRISRQTFVKVPPISNFTKLLRVEHAVVLYVRMERHDHVNGVAGLMRKHYKNPHPIWRSCFPVL